MSSRFDDLWEFSVDLDEPRPSLPQTDNELEQVLEAWYRERSHRIEACLLLDEVRGLLRKLVAEGDLTPRRSRQAHRILQAFRRLGEELS